MATQLTSNAEALRLFFTEDIYLVAESNSTDKMVGVLDTLISKENAIEKTPIAVQKNKTAFNFLGKNQKNILILVNDLENDVSTAQGRELLRKLVKAINLTNNDFALVNYASYASEKYEQLSSFFSCKVMMAFGVAPVELDLPVQPLNQLVVYSGATHLFAKNLHDLDADVPSKKLLWTSLQQLNV